MVMDIQCLYVVVVATALKRVIVELKKRSNRIENKNTKRASDVIGSRLLGRRPIWLASSGNSWSHFRSCHDNHTKTIILDNDKMTQDPGIAGRTNYRKWDKVAVDLVETVEAEEEQEALENAEKLGLDGRYAVSESEAEERHKAKQVKHVKKTLDKYKKREDDVIQTCSGLLGPVKENNDDDEKTTKNIVRITRDMVDAGKRVITVCDTSGASRNDMIILTQDLSQLESKMAANATTTPKEYSGDAQNDKHEPPQTRSVYGLIKLFIANVHNCTVVLKCKLISGTVEMSHCTNVTLKIEKEACVATLQMDLCQHVHLEFYDAPSGKNTGHPMLYWGEDVNDRIFTAGVSNMSLKLYRDGFVDMETTVDYLKDGATAVGNASAEEMQFVTSVVNGELHTERVVRHGSTTGTSARAMTQRELDAEKEKREQAVDMVMEKAIRFEEKGEAKKVVPVETVAAKEEEIEEVYTSMSKSEIKEIISECEGIKVRGNEAFAAGEYAQAVLFYSLALDKADELPDKESGTQPLFARHIILANRSAAFLKLGEHEKALADATRAQEIDPTYVKGVFRKGLALHAMGRYLDAIQVLAKAHKLEPYNQQIKQALTFSERRLQQEMQRR